MNQFRILASLFSLALLCASFAGHAANVDEEKYALPTGYFTTRVDSGDTLKYPLKDSESTDPEGAQRGKVDLKDPENLKTEVKYNPETGKYEITQKIGDVDYRPPTYLSFEEYIEYQKQRSLTDYWKDKQSAESEFEEGKSKAFKPELKIKSKTFDRIFGGNTIDIKPSGSAELSFGLRISKTNNPVIPVRNRRVTTFQFDQNMQINLVGSIGDKLKITTNYNTQATFDFQNQFKLDYTGYEDEIIQKIELGNVAMPLNSQLMTGSQSLFGVKLKTKFGRLTMTTVLSQDKGQRSEVETQGGAQINEFEVKADNYEGNKHFFLDRYFRDVYERAVSDPMVLQTGVNITRLEIWVTNTRTNGDAPRDVIAFQDMGTTPYATNPDGTPVLDGTGFPVIDEDRYFNNRWITGGIPVTNPYNRANSLYDEVNGPNGFGSIEARSMDQAIPVLQQKMNLDPRMDFQKVEFAKKLNPNEYTFHPQLGYISLKQQVATNQVLAVAYEYTLNGQTYQVGEFSTDLADKPLLVKMLKSTETNTRVPMWDLMMKNIYSIGAYRVKRDGFRFDVWYLDQSRGVDINFIPQPELNDMSLVQLLGMDTLDFNGQPRRDGLFDFVEGITINTQNGRIIIPKVEPFGSGLRQAFEEFVGDPVKVDAYLRLYAFDSLYTNTQADAKVRWPERNRFSLKGRYQSESSNEIPLNAINVPEGSVTVTAGGQKLIENQDYTVDYNLGRVKIINPSIIESGQPIKVSLESNQLFAQQQKNFLGHRMDYKISDDFLVGGTIMHLWERPLTQKVDIGYEPISNWMWGLDLSYRSELDWLTRAIDKIPGIDTKEKSTVSVAGEFAQLLPGHSRTIGQNGNSYIDDFEGSQNSISLQSFSRWFLASTPQHQPDLFPEGGLFDNPAQNFNRALFNWRVVDPFFYDPSLGPDHVVNDAAMLSNNFMRQILETEVFPERELPPGQIQNIQMFDLSFYPTERGPYNFDIDGRDSTGRTYSAGLDSAGFLRSPESRWGGIMTRIDQNDFEASNIEYVQFWVMDPFNDDYEGDPQDGALYVNLGNISEDVMFDGQKTFEQLLPRSEAESESFDSTSSFSNVARVTPGNAYTNGFDNDPATRPWQDIGLDGLKSGSQEPRFYSDYVDAIDALILDPTTRDNIKFDPSNDDFHHYRGTDYDNAQLDILERYKLFNGVEGNSPTDEQNIESYSTSGTTNPDREDINNDNTINQTESYYQYKVAISPQDLRPENVGNNFITDYKLSSYKAADGTPRQVGWYQIRIPVRSANRTKHGNIVDLRSVYFMRMFMRGFTNPVHLRFARVELVRGEWRRFYGEIDDNPEGIVTDYEVDFNVGAVNLEENSAKVPVNYVLPPDIQREINVNTTALQQINEQSLQLTVCDLPDGIAQATYKNTQLDIRMYGRLKMFVHAETLADQPKLQDDDLTVFIRLGSDFSDNYYEYELPMKVTPPGSYNPNHEPHQRTVWPDANQVDLELRALTDLKLDRDRKILEGESTLLSRVRHTAQYGNGAIYVVGNPNLNNIKTIMIGIRNPRAVPNDGNDDDGLNKCAEVWVNELRLSDFDQTKGYAMVGQANIKMADFANVALSGGYSTPGWGSLDKKVSERQKETRKNYNVTAAVNLDKFFPEKWGVKLPMYASYSADIKDPQFSPLAPDIEFEDYVDAWETKSQKDSVKRVMQDRTIRRSINFTNVRKERTGDKKPTPIDISNFSVSYAFSEEKHTDFETQRDVTKTTKVDLTYSYALSPKPVKPLSKVKALRESDYLKLARELNFYYLPKSFSFSTNMNRLYNAFQMRNTNPGLTARLPEFYNKQFTWNRDYNFKYDITRNLKFDFAANNQALIREPNGPAERSINGEGQYDAWKSAVWDEIKNFGHNMNYSHSANLNYKIPLDYIPIANWVNSNVRYGATYSWRRAPLGRDFLGNTIQNSNSINFTNNFNFKRLYTKWSYLKKVEQRARRHAQLKARPKQKKDKTKEPDANADGEKDPDAKKKKKPKSNYSFGDRVVKFAMMFSNGNLTYGRNRGTLIPGWGEEHEILGMNPSFTAPGLDFIFGNQYDSEGPNTFWKKAADKGWLKDTSGVNYRVSQTYSENITFRVSAEPIRDLRVTLNGSRRESWNYSLFYRFNDTSRTYNEESPIRQGTLTMSFWSFSTAFVKDDALTGSNRVFEEFLTNRVEISRRLGAQDPNSNGDHEVFPEYAEGYGPTSADVLIPSFLAAYSGQGAGSQKLNIFSILPAINYRINYNGLGKIPALRKLFRTITLSSAYSSNLSIGGYTQNQRYLERDPVTGDLVLDLDSNYYTRYQYNVVTITEQFQPLINVDMQFNNKVTARAEYRKSRTVGLNVGSAQIMETKTEAYTLGLGYQFPMVFPITIGGKKPKSDTKLRADFSYRKNKTVIRRIVENTHTPSAGQDVVSVKFTADYALTKALNLRVFYDYVLNIPQISNSFRTANTNAGFSLRFSIS